MTRKSTILLMKNMFQTVFLKKKCFFENLVSYSWRPLKRRREGARVSGSGNQIINVTAAADQISQLDLI